MGDEVVTPEGGDPSALPSAPLPLLEADQTRSTIAPPDAAAETAPTVDLGKIDGAPTEIPGASDVMAQKELNLLAHEAEQFRRELGWLGHPFGGRREKPGNISVIVILFCFLGMAVLYLDPPKPNSDMSFERIWGGLTSMVTLVLGYLFGSNDKGGK
jgi:hypothetical protein